MPLVAATHDHRTLQSLGFTAVVWAMVLPSPQHDTEGFSVRLAALHCPSLAVLTVSSLLCRGCRSWVPRSVPRRSRRTAGAYTCV
jgi:hypothetical protein